MQGLIDGGFSKKQRRDKGNLDKMSAAIILQDYLNQRV
jgi:putative Holliday junction resolvase